MRHYIFLKKGGKKMPNIKIYGSAKALLDNEKIEINGHTPNYDRMMYLLGGNHQFEDKKYLIKRCEVIRKKQL